MEQIPEAKTTFDKLSFIGKKDYVNWITDAKKDETRKNRVEKAVQMLAEGKKLK